MNLEDLERNLQRTPHVPTPASYHTPQSSSRAMTVEQLEQELTSGGAPTRTISHSVPVQRSRSNNQQQLPIGTPPKMTQLGHVS